MEDSNNPNIIIILLDQASRPFAWENEQAQEFRKKYMPNMEYIKNNSIVLNNHHISSAACVPSRATLLTGVNSNKTLVHHTDGVAKSAKELEWIDPKKTPTLGNILIDSGKYKREDVVYIGKHHLKEGILFDEEGRRIETIDREGNLNRENLDKYLKEDMLGDLGFTYLSGPDPHGTSMLNAGFLVDPGFVEIAVDWLKNRENNFDPFVQVLSLVEPHDLVYFPNIWLGLWGNKISKKLDLNDIPVSPTDTDDLSQYPLAYQHWVKRYGTYFTNQNPKMYRQFYYYLLTLADDTLGTFLNYFKTSTAANNCVVIFTSDHGDLCGTHGNGYQKWYTPYEEVTNVFCNIMRFKNGLPCWKGVIDYPTSHIDIVPTICKMLEINYDGFDGINIFDPNKKSKAIKCYIRDHITMGNNLVRFPWRIFPQLPNVNKTFAPVDYDDEGKVIICPEYAISITWRIINDILYKLAIYHDPEYQHIDLNNDNVNALIDKNLILLYDLTSDRCETKNIVKENINIVTLLCKEFTGINYDSGNKSDE